MKLEAKIDRMVQKGNVKAIASVSLDGMFVVKGLKVMDGRKGLFVSMPQEAFSSKGGEKQYSNTLSLVMPKFINIHLAMLHYTATTKH